MLCFVIRSVLERLYAVCRRLSMPVCLVFWVLGFSLSSLSPGFLVPLSEVLVPFIRVPKCKVLVPFIRVPKCLAKFLYPFIRLRLFCGRCVDYRVINPLSSPDGWVDANEWIAMMMMI
jgi:hypothetical protein